MELKLKDKAAVVTGASRGIGRAIAIELARQGANVTVNYAAHEEEAREVAHEIERLGSKALVFRADVSDRSSDMHMLDETLRTFGRLDILVNNAAFSIRKPFLQLSVAEVERTWAVSLWGVFHCSQLAALRMVEQGTGGNILVIGSVHSFRPYPNATAYNAAKAAVNQMAATWAIELAPHRIRVNVLEPGWTDTPGERAFFSEEEIKDKGKTLLMGRLATADEMAKAALFLLSDDASYVTGSCFRADGGFAITH